MLSLIGIALATGAGVALPARSAQPASPPAPPGIYHDLEWRMIGPLRGGRTRAVAGVPSQPNVFYVGAVNGGVWKTDDAGRTWRPIFDDQPTQSIGAIAVAPADPNIIYVASGEGLHRPDLSVGNGIYRSATTAVAAGRISASATGSRSRSWRWTRAIPTGCSPRCSAIPTARTPSAASTVRWTRESPGSGFCTAMRIPAARRSRSIRPAARSCTRPCGNRAWVPGRTRTSSRAPAAGCSSPPTAAAPGSG